MFNPGEKRWGGGGGFKDSSCANARIFRPYLYQRIDAGKGFAPESGRTFRVLGHVKSLPPGTGRFFGYRGKLCGWREKYSGINSRIFYP
jgi:hypothetical protein